MTNDQLLIDAYGRIRDGVHRVLDGCPPATLLYRPDPAANPIAWLVWHLTRVQDDHLAELAGTEQVWTRDGWADRFGLPYEPEATGYGHSAQEVGQFSVTSSDLLGGYLDAVHEASCAFLATVGDTDLERIVDRAWEPPVTMGVRLVSVLSDGLQHLGQAAYVRGCAARAGS